MDPKNLLLIAFALFSTTSPAQEWIDITSEYLDDPSFTRGNYEGWDFWGWANSTATRANAQEFWNGSWDFSKTIASPITGRYRISVQAYFRPRNFSNEDLMAHENGTEQILCFLYAGEDHVPVASVYSAYSDHSTGDCWTYSFRDENDNRVRRYYPNGMESGVAMFNMGFYNNELETNVSSGQDLTFGVRCDWDGYQDSNWFLCSNWKIEWFGNEVPASSIRLNEQAVTLAPGEVHQLVATVAPANATFKKLAFASSDESVVTVDQQGNITAKSSGTARIVVSMALGSSTAQAVCTVTVKETAISVGDLMVNEVQQSNVDMFLDPSFNFGGWVELFNPTDNSLSLNGLYISDDPLDLKKMPLDARFGAVPAHGFHCLWFDHYSRWAPAMVNFKLDCDGGAIYLADANGNLLLQQDYPPAITRTSYARTIDGGDTWGYTDQPTPGKNNTSSSFAATRLEAPHINHAGGFFTSEFVAHVVIPSGATLRYTTDGSTPTLQNGETSTNGRFTISQTTILRLRLFQTGKLSSPVVTRSFIFKNQDYTLPVISLVTDNENLYGADYGIFARGNGNGRPGNGQSSPCNWNMDWDRPANIEYFDESGTAVFSQEVSVEAAGGWSRAWGLHSFNIKANKVYEGLNRMDYPFFEQKPYLRHKALKVRNGGNDSGDRIKDAAIQEVVRTSGLYVETQCYKPVHVFHNGEYIGVENLREPNNSSYAYANYGIDTDNQDQWKMSPDSGYVQQRGTRDAFEQLMALSASASDPVVYGQIQELLDIEEYANYMAVELYICGTDWPQNNIKSFRERSEGTANSKFRFILFDTDGAFATNSPFTTFADKKRHTYDRLLGQDVIQQYGTQYITGEIEFVTLFLNLIKNETFKRQFVDQFCLVEGSVFRPARAREIINAMVEHVNPAMSLEWASASGSANTVIGQFSSTRQTNMITALRNYFGLGRAQTVRLSTNIPEARLLVNGLEVPTAEFNGHLFAPVTVQALAPAGYRFKGWSSNSATQTTELFGKGSSWNYYDQGSLDNQEWTGMSYTANWPSGAAPLGYFVTDASNGRGYKTFLGYGDDTNNKYPTYYFRKEVVLSGTSATNYTLDWVADDGFVVYVNGQEAGRYLMPSGKPSFGTFASSYAPANPESGSMPLDAKLFRNGVNVIAVEVHNNAANSTDIYWDAALTREQDVDTQFASSDATYTLPEGNMTLVATFEPLDAAELPGTDAHPVKINEVSAGNTIFANEQFKRNDWIELYNTTSTDIDVAGMYLSDHLDQPEKFQIPASNGTFSTLLPAHGHLVIWADKLESLTQLHADFKLNNEDSCCVLLTAADHSWADTLTYCCHSGTQSVGLYPDGGSSLYVMDRPTIGTTNVLTTTAQVWEEPKPLVDGIAPLQDEQMAESDIIFDLNGRRRGSRATLQRLPSGIYILNGRKIIK